MQIPTSRKVSPSTFITNKVHLPLIAMMTAVFLIIFFSSAGQTESTAVATIPTTCPGELLTNGDFELPLETAGGAPLNWSTSQWIRSSYLSREHGNAHSGVGSARIVAQVLNDSWFWQEVTVEPQTLYLLTGWIRTENVSGGAGANLSLIGTWSHTEGLYGTNPWTRVSLIINSGSSTKLTIGARLGYWSSTSKGTAWFDDLQLKPINSKGNRSRWKILVLIYDRTDAVVTDSKGVRHHMVGAMTPAEVERATLAATQFVETDIPALTSGHMIPELTIRYPEHALTQLDPVGEGWSPSPANTAADRDPNFDSVIVIWDPRVIDEPGTRRWIGAAAGLATPMGRGQTYAAIIIEATGYGHRNVFKHEWGHCILSYFEAMGTTPQPTVMTHANIGQYVHWPTGNAYVWVDETDANPIPNSIYNNESGFTHDYYSGTTATADQPERRLGITPEAWSLGGPVTKPIAAFPPAVLACGEDVTVRKEDNNCWSRVSLAPPTGSDGCELNFTAVATRSDGLPMNAPYPCGQTVVTWSVANGAATCEQVVTVNDLVPPIFLYSATPLIVTTGPGATSCGTVVDDTRLGIPVSTADPVMLDPTGDALINDIVSIAATTDGQALTMTVTFADYVFPASSGDARGLTGYIEIDSDSNPETGVASSIDPMGLPKLNMGVEFQIDLGSELAHPGLVDITLKQGGPVKIGQVPILFSEKSFLLVVPLAMLGNGNGMLSYAVGVGVAVGQTDRAPNDAVPVFSRLTADVLAVDDCAGVTISRSGIPVDNFFPVGETLITYTAKDASGNTAFMTRAVTVVDDTPPVITAVAASPSLLWPPNRDMVDVTVSYDAADNCALLETSLSVSSNAPSDGGIGLDWEVVDAHHVRLRAARSVRGGHRSYTVTITAKDIHGNLSSRDITVDVRQNKGRRLIN